MSPTDKQTSDKDYVHEKGSSELLKAKLPNTTGVERYDLISEILFSIGFTPTDVADIYLEEMIQIATKINLPQKLCKALHFRAELYRQAERIKDCRHNYELALKVSDANDRKEQYARSLRGIGQSYHISKEEDEAELYFERARKYTKKHGLSHEYIWALNCLGNVYNAKFLYDKGIEVLVKAIELSKANNEGRS